MESLAWYRMLFIDGSPDNFFYLDTYPYFLTFSMKDYIDYYAEFGKEKIDAGF